MKQVDSWNLSWTKMDPVTPLHELKTRQELTATLASGPTTAFAATKMLMQHAASTDFDTHLALEASTQKSCAESDDYSEGVEAFLQKRAAKFTGS